MIMHPLITAAIAAAHAKQAAHPPVAAAAALAVLGSAVIVAILKVAGRILSPRRRQDARPSSPYAAPARRGR